MEQNKVVKNEGLNALIELIRGKNYTKAEVNSLLASIRSTYYIKSEVDAKVEALQGSVNEALRTAEETVVAVSIAQSAANTAQSTANSANTAAEEAKSAVDSKQDKLISGTNIKTINDTSLLGEGNIELDATFTQPEKDGLGSFNYDKETGKPNNFTSTLPAGTKVSLGDALETIIKNQYAISEALKTAHTYFDEQVGLILSDLDTGNGASGPYDPNNPTLSGLKKALAAENYNVFPIGTKVLDSSDAENPWVVAHYGSAKDANNEEVRGVYLIKKYALSDSLAFASAKKSDYSTSTIKDYLTNTYYPALPEEWKESITEIKIPYYNGSTLITLNEKVWLMSVTELYGVNQEEEGEAFQYWKNKTDLASAKNETSLRIIQDKTGEGVNVWTRSRYNSETVYGNDKTGSIRQFTGTTSPQFILPACFISAS